MPTAVPAFGGRPVREADTVRRVVELVRSRLPAGWSVSLGAAGGRAADTVAEVTAPGRGRAGRLAIEVKQHLLAPRDLSGILDRLAALAPVDTPLVVAPFLPKSVRAKLDERGISYGDVTGNIRLQLDQPALFLRDVGAAAEPWPGPGRPPGGLGGPAACRVVRALIDFAPPVSVPELARRAGASIGATYRVVELLDREELLIRTPRGPITAVSWRRLVERWSDDYGFTTNNQRNRYLEPRELDELVRKLPSASVPYAVTGSMAAARLAPYAPALLAMIYTTDEETLVRELNLRPVDYGNNIVIADTKYDMVFDRTVLDEGVRFVSPSQTAVDLLTGPGRNPVEGMWLLDWMERNESLWRG